MPDDTTVRPLSEDYRPNVGDVVAVKGTVLSFERSPTPLGADLWRIEVADEIIYIWAGHRDAFAPWIDPATIAQRDALIEELRARVKELEK